MYHCIQVATWHFIDVVPVVTIVYCMINVVIKIKIMVKTLSFMTLT